MNETHGCGQFVQNAEWPGLVTIKIAPFARCCHALAFLSSQASGVPEDGPYCHVHLPKQKQSLSTSQWFPPPTAWFQSPTAPPLGTSCPSLSPTGVLGLQIPGHLAWPHLPIPINLLHLWEAAAPSGPGFLFSGWNRQPHTFHRGRSVDRYLGNTSVLCLYICPCVLGIGKHLRDIQA